jgi:hypothetical protein
MDLALREEYSITFCTKLIVVISLDNYYSQFNTLSLEDINTETCSYRFGLGREAVDLAM